VTIEDKKGRFNTGLRKGWSAMPGCAERLTAPELESSLPQNVLHLSCPGTCLCRSRRPLLALPKIDSESEDFDLLTLIYRNSELGYQEMRHLITGRSRS
jgi:hypothetical protein